MKRLTSLALAAAVAVVGAPALAQTPPAHPTFDPAMRTRIRQIHQTERTQILNALTPAHKSLLATTVGALATSANPDFRAAANRLDSALSAGEKQAIVSAAQNARTQMRSVMQSMRAQMPAPPQAMQRMRRTPDAGEILLRLAMPGPGMGMMRHPGMHP
jgi:hypothetical protein